MLFRFVWQVNRVGGIMDSYQQYIHKSRYARWLENEGRRETWAETVRRYTDFWVERGQIDQETSDRLYKAIYNQDGVVVSDQFHNQVNPKISLLADQSEISYLIYYNL